MIINYTVNCILHTYINKYQYIWNLELGTVELAIELAVSQVAFQFAVCDRYSRCNANGSCRPSCGFSHVRSTTSVWPVCEPSCPRTCATSAMLCFPQSWLKQWRCFISLRISRAQRILVIYPALPALTWRLSWPECLPVSLPRLFSSTTNPSQGFPV